MTQRKSLWFAHLMKDFCSESYEVGPNDGMKCTYVYKLFNAAFILLVEDDYMYVSPFNTPRDTLRMCKVISGCSNRDREKIQEQEHPGPS